jgi:hypothetical protein
MRIAPRRAALQARCTAGPAAALYWTALSRLHCRPKLNADRNIDTGTSETPSFSLLQRQKQQKLVCR